MVDELGIVEWVDRLLPKNQEKQIVSYGQAVKAMILNGLGYNQRTLYLTPHFFQDKPWGVCWEKALKRSTSMMIYSHPMHLHMAYRPLYQLPSVSGSLAFLRF